jgi:UDP-N-acetylmuramyl pentapeptide synthase
MSKDHCFNFQDSLEAGKFLQQRIYPGDLLLIKGSQGMRMEKTVKELMAEPQKAEELLVRQGKEWQ